MTGFEFLDEIVLLCIAAVAAILAFKRIGMPPIIGLIVTGLMLGPSGFGLVTQSEVINVLSELGIVLLLFSIGLEFSLDDLKKLKNIVLVGGPLQVTFSTIVIGCGALVVSVLTSQGISLEAALLIGMSMSLSSTAICTKILKDRRELGLPHGRAVMGILIFQDIAVVPLMIIVTLISPRESIDISGVVIKLVTLVVVAVGLIVGLRIALPKIVPYVTRSSTPEVLILGGLALCFGTAWITSSAGISMALGAFIAGVAIAGSEEGHAFGRVLQPMRDAFTSVFFLSIGLLVNISWSWLPINLLTASAILVANAIVVALVLMSLRINLRTSVMAAIILAQVGEFSFVLATAGHQFHVISDFDFQNMIVSIIITMIVAPTLITFAPVFAERTAPLFKQLRPIRKWYQTRSPLELLREEKEADDIKPVVTIVGGGVLGKNVASVLMSNNIPHRILELNGSIVKKLRDRGHTVVQGDATDTDALEHAGIEYSSVVVIAISDHTALAQCVEAIRKCRPDVLIIVRTRYAKDSALLAQRGADIVVTEEYESSIQVFVTILEHLGIEEGSIQQQEELMRSNKYGVLARLKKDDN